LSTEIGVRGVYTVRAKTESNFELDNATILPLNLEEKVAPVLPSSSEFAEVNLRSFSMPLKLSDLLELKLSANPKT